MNRLGREDVPLEEDVPIQSNEDESEKSGEGNGTPMSDDPSSSTRLNPEAKPFKPTSGAITPLRETVLRRVHETTASTNVSAAPSPTPNPVTPEEGEEKEDIEMGEVSEPPRESPRKKTRVKEELEEGEASDESSELSDLPDS
jgi:THO complex subunit 7